MLHYFKWPFIMTALGLIASYFVGLGFVGSFKGGLGFLFICCVLAILEISLSFDNAIVNANKLKDMSPIWRQRFLTWGILIAVFGMRIVFPLLIVMMSAGLGPVEAMYLSIHDPAQYSVIISDAHVLIAAFGAAFLMLVALGYFIDNDKDVDWIGLPERALRKCAKLRGVKVAIAGAIAAIFALFVDPSDQRDFIVASGVGIITYLMVNLLGDFLDRQDIADHVAKGGLGAFLYLEVLDSSFSFDGVIGAFALTQNLFLIAIGLGIGAFYVRSMTIMLLEKGVLTEYRYLENGAFWSILVLSIMMAAQALFHIPEVVMGLFSVLFIGLALWCSLRDPIRQGLE